ncbi:hypothetical protein [Fodinibius sp. SL11]|uniref:hypothetical protein n=1 Tax=Fodinibius sp. SL11 TaxID=3425690 RepID=UPI003F881372
MFNKQIARGIVLLVFAGLITGCGSQKLMNGQKQMRSSFQSGEYEKADHIADSLKENDIYEAKDRVLYALEKGTINYFKGDYEQSVESYTNAEEYIDQFFSKSVKTGIGAFISNDTQLNYNGEVYEDVYLNAFKSLGYLKMNNFESALVEARRIAQKLSEAEQKYGEYASAMAESDTTEKDITWEAGTSNIHDSPLSHYLAGALYAKAGEQDGARIEMDKLKKAINNHQAMPDSKLEFDSTFTRVQDPDQYNTMVMAFCGKAPDKVDNSINTDINRDGKGVKIAIPKLVMQPSNVAAIEAVINDTMSIELKIIEEMDKVARETFKIKKPIIVARATIRGVLKSAAQEGVSDAVEDEFGSVAGDVASFIGGKAREASEQADLRGWQTMPANIYTNVIKLPAGEHDVTFNYYSAERELLYSEARNINIGEQERLEPVASIYSN